MEYLDTSVLVALYIPEHKSDKIQSFVETCHSVAISSLTEVEFYSATSRLLRMKHISRQHAQQVTSQFQVHLKSDVYDIHPIMQREYDLAREWIGAFNTPLRTLDALHLAAAFAYDLRLVTADVRFANAAKKIGIKTKRNCSPPT